MAKSGVFVPVVGSLWQTDPRLAVCRLQAFRLTNPNSAARPPAGTLPPPFPPSCSRLNLRIRPFSREQSGREEGAGASALPSLTGALRSLCKHLPARVYLDVSRSKSSTVTRPHVTLQANAVAVGAVMEKKKI